VLDKVKELLTKALVLVPLAEKEPLLLYIAATMQVVSAKKSSSWRTSLMASSSITSRDDSTRRPTR
jgi:hypothetical protein